MDSTALAQLVDFVGIYKQDSLLIIRHGKIVVDAYYAPFAPNIRHDLRSVTKSFISTLTGIEVQEGLLDGVDHPIVDLFTDKHISNLDDGKKAITVQNMLDMTSGIAWSEDAYTPDETIIRMYKTPDPTEFVLSQPMSDPPGARFYYNGGNPYVLSALITKKAGRDALDFARDELFKPLGISSVRWGEADAQGVTDGESGLYLAPHDVLHSAHLPERIEQLLKRNAASAFTASAAVASAIAVAIAIPAAAVAGATTIIIVASPLFEQVDDRARCFLRLAAGLHLAFLLDHSTSVRASRRALSAAGAEVAGHDDPWAKV
jgi:CubicO group peptidase (beta-lactamase class C family)